ncbi:MAG TPA: two-component regulator propeller domain-containing protein [Mucilaginibacter sp.]|nr:two-component regulator propeller domain-containing protein [Mucilaginibacter sp.]
MKRIVLFFQLFLSGGYCLYAQTILPHFETLSVNDGLSQSSVYSILQDKEGFMWFGTSDGLNRYDGSEIRVFRFSDNIKEPSNANIVGRLCEDDKGNIWYSNFTGIFYYDRIKQEIYKAWSFTKNKFPNNYLSLVTYQKGIIYFENIITGIVSYNIKTGLMIRYPYPYKIKLFNWNDHPIDYRAVFHDSKIWSHGASLNGLYTFDIRSKKFGRFVPGQGRQGIESGQKNKYIVDHQKIVILDAQSRYIDTLAIPAVNRNLKYFSATEDKYQHVWIATINNGLIMYDIASKKFFTYRHENSKAKSLPIDLVTTTYIDANNNLWIGTDGGGVCRLDIKPKKFNQFPLNEGEYPFMNDYFTKCIYDDNAGNVYFGSLSNGLCVLNKTTGQLKQFKNTPGKNTSIQSNTVSAIFSDKDHNIWVGSTLGISIFKNGSFRRINVRNLSGLEYYSNMVNRFCQLSNGNIVAASRSGLILFEKKGDSFEGLYIIKNGFETSDIVEAVDHQLWIGCPGNGLQRITIGTDSIITHERYFPGTNIRSIHVDERDPNILWICTVKGLIRFYCHSKNFRVYNQLDGMANSYVYGALEDDKHDLWLSTNSGITYFDREERTFKNYNVKDGLQSNEFNSGAFFKSTSGTLYFGGIKGFNWFYPSQLAVDRSGPLIGITAAAIDNESILKDSVFATNKQLTLPYNKKSVLFRFAVLDYTLPQANTIEYKLEGWESKWFRTENKDIRYSNLTRGDFTLRVRAINSSDIKSRELSIKIRVLPPFWKTWTFVGIVFFVGVIAIVWITINIAQRKLKQKLAVYERQKELERERQRISREMHDDIGAGLTQITLMSESINKNGVKKTRELTDIAETSRKLVANMSEIIWSMNPANNTLDEFFAYMREGLHKLLEYSGMEYDIHVSDCKNDTELNGEQKRNLLLAVKEIVNNAIKYSHAKKITVGAEFIGNELHFTISDDGVGFEPGCKVSGSGLNNIKKRIEDLGGSLTITSGKNEGSSFHFFIPLKSHL